MSRLPRSSPANATRNWSLINTARAAVQAILARKVTDVAYDPATSPELQACVELISTWGLGFHHLGEEAARPPLYSWSYYGIAEWWYSKCFQSYLKALPMPPAPLLWFSVFGMFFKVSLLKSVLVRWCLDAV